MAAASTSQNGSSRRPAGVSDSKWKEILHAKLVAKRKKGRPSSSLFLDWKKDVKDSAPSPKNLR